MPENRGVLTHERAGAFVVCGCRRHSTALARLRGAVTGFFWPIADPAHLDRLVAASRAEGHDARSLLCDVTDPVAIARFALTVSEAGPLAVVAHAVGL